LGRAPLFFDGLGDAPKIPHSVINHANHLGGRS
jgi:hypothetical protein